MSTLSTNDVVLCVKPSRSELAVSGYLRELEHDLVAPLDIIKLISKFHFQINSSINSRLVNAHILKSVPSSVSLYNQIPTIHPSFKGMSQRSLLNATQFCRDMCLWIFLTGLICWFYIAIVNGHNYVEIVIAAIVLFCGICCCCIQSASSLQDCYHIILKPINTPLQRIVSLNDLFDIELEIEFYICGYHFARDGDNNQVTVTTFNKTQSLQLQHVETMFHPNIFEDDEIYNHWCYHFDFDLLVKFDHEQERIKYEQICKRFINENIHDQYQDCRIDVKYQLHGRKRMISATDSHNYFIIVHAEHDKFRKFLLSVMGLFSMLCLSWIYKFLFYIFIKRKRFVITKYISIDRLNAVVA